MCEHKVMLVRELDSACSLCLVCMHLEQYTVSHDSSRQVSQCYQAPRSHSSRISSRRSTYAWHSEKSIRASMHAPPMHGCNWINSRSLAIDRGKIAPHVRARVQISINRPNYCFPLCEHALMRAQTRSDTYTSPIAS